MSSIRFTTDSICAAVSAASRPATAASAGARLSGASVSGARVLGARLTGAPAARVAGDGFVKQASKHLAMTRTYIDGWPPGPLGGTSG